MKNLFFDSIGFVLLKVFRAHQGLVRCKMRDLGLHRGQPPVLFALYENDGISNSEMAEYLEITPATLTNKVKRMEKSQLVVRRGDPDDERLSRIYLTDKGRGLMDTLRGSMLDMEEILLSGFSDSETQQLKRLLARLVENVDSYQSGPGKPASH